MSEFAFNVLQFGRQSVVGTAVAASTIFPADPGVGIDLDRGYTSPDEDFGVLSRHQAGRGSYGLRGAQLTIPAVARFEDLMHVLERRLAGGVVPSGAGPYTYTYNLDETSDTAKFYTIENGSETSQDQWRATGCVATDLELGFDSLAAPGEAPWKTSETVIALDRQPNAKTGALTAPVAMETIEGHLTTLLEGTTATAFASLAELTASLIQFRLKISGDRPRRAYGNNTPADLASGFGIVKPEVTFDAQVKVSATSKTNVHDIFNAAGAVAGERRWRVKAVGSGTKVLTIDGRVRFMAIPIGDRDGERIYQVSGHYLKDATLASSLQIVLINSVSTIP